MLSKYKNERKLLILGSFYEIYIQDIRRYRWDRQIERSKLDANMICSQISFQMSLILLAKIARR